VAVSPALTIEASETETIAEPEVEPAVEEPVVVEEPAVEEPVEIVAEPEYLEMVTEAQIPVAPEETEVQEVMAQVVAIGSECEHSKGLTCPNCGSPLEGRKCKLLCLKPGCGYMVTCSEW
jgi:hypothetical protein